MSGFPVCGICGWTRAIVGRTRAQTGGGRPWVGAWIWWSVRRSPPRKRCLGRELRSGPKRAWPQTGRDCAPQRLRGVAEEVGGGEDDRLDRPAKEDEQRLREAVCERGGDGVRCHDPPHDEAARPSLTTFHTASEGEFCELRRHGVLRSSARIML